MRGDQSKMHAARREVVKSPRNSCKMIPNGAAEQMMTIRRFGPFRLDAETQILFCGDEPTMLGQRAVALLRVLLERAGEPVSKDALIEAAWPGLAIENSNLTVQIAAMRRVLEEAAGSAAWIETLPRRGYRYVGPKVSTGEQPEEASLRIAPPLALPDKPSIAVLAFSNLSGDPEQEYFADGIVEDIISGLSRIKWLFVVARNSSFSYKGKAIDVKQIGRDLGVRYVLEGSLRKAGTRLRVTTQLIEAQTGSHLWAERYDRNLDDLFLVQDEITVAVVGAIEPNLRAAEIEHVKRKRPESLDAYDLVLRALPEVYTCMPAGATKSLAFIERALALEPNYPLAHGVAAWAHEILFVRDGMREKNRRGAIDHAHAAITHGLADPMALTFGAFSIALVEHDRQVAFEAFEEAVKLSPSCGPAFIFGAAPFSFAGQAERAIDWGERALRLSPFDPMSYVAYHGIAVGNFQLGRYEEAAKAARKAIQSNPKFSFSYALLAAPLAKLGRTEEARDAVVRLRELQPNFSICRQCEAVGIVPVVAEPMIEALCTTGLPD
jgi:TolB-like protein